MKPVNFLKVWTIKIIKNMFTFFDCVVGIVTFVSSDFMIVRVMKLLMTSESDDLYIIRKIIQC